MSNWRVPISAADEFRRAMKERKPQAQECPVVRERLADYAHAAWSGWMFHLFRLSKRNDDGSVTIPPDLVTRWGRQVGTAYSCLPESEKDSDRKEADRMLAIVRLAPEKEGEK